MVKGDYIAHSSRSYYTKDHLFNYKPLKVENYLSAMVVFLPYTPSFNICI